MPWFKVDDNFCFHPKTILSGNAAIGLWVRAGSWSMQNLTDGWIPVEVARKLGSRASASRLVDAGLWELKPDGYHFHEWEIRQPSRIQVVAGREAERNRKSRSRRRRPTDPEPPEGDRT